MAECNFYVGQKVVCIKRDPWRRFVSKRPTPAPTPTYQHVYTVAAVLFAFGGAFLDLEGFPLVETKTDISIFQRILADVNAGKVKEVSDVHREPV